MSGYKRVNFYELCRLCASNQQKEKTHIFQEEGRKIQLQNKIQSCLSLTVCENDFLPKVVCSQCLRSLEECYLFRKECVTSESMLSSYFNNFRYTEDFKKSGKVYIKDTSSKTSATASQTTQEPVSSTTTNNLSTPVLNNVNFIPEVVKNEQIPVYAVQLPTLIHNEAKNVRHDQKPAQAQVAYSINPLNLAVVNKNGLGESIQLNPGNEVINIAQLVDFDSIICQPKMKLQNAIRQQKHSKLSENDQNVIKIELAQPDLNNFEVKLPQVKQTNNRPTYSIKIDDFNQQVLPVQQLTNIYQNAGNVNVSYGNGVNLNAQSVQTAANVICSAAGATGIAQVVQNQVEKQNSAALSQVIQSPQIQRPPVPNFTQNCQTVSVNVSVKQNYPNSEEQNFTSEPKQSNFTEMSEASQQCQQPNSKIHTCDICRKTFKRREHLYQHVKLHTGFRPFTCENCNKSFVRKEHVLRHMTSHSGQKNFTCTICDKSFSRNDNLLKHKKTHEKQSSFTCDICQKQFVMKHYYLAHKMTHENDKCGINQVWGLLKT